MLFPTKAPLRFLFVFKRVFVCAHVPRRTVHVRQELHCVGMDAALQAAAAAAFSLVRLRSGLVHADHAAVCVSSLPGDSGAGSKRRHSCHFSS